MRQVTLTGDVTDPMYGRKVPCAAGTMALECRELNGLCSLTRCGGSLLDLQDCSCCALTASQYPTTCNLLLTNQRTDCQPL
jgi:hypothetical protein